MKRVKFRQILPLALTASLWGCSHPEEKLEPNAPQVVKAQIETVQDSSVESYYAATGTVRAQMNSSLSSKAIGKVISVSVHDGEEVRKGQVLIEIDPRELKSSVDMASANYQASLAGVENAKTAARMQDRTSRAQIAQAEANVRQATATLAAAEAKRDLAKAGPRTQEVAQAHITVMEAESNLNLARLELDRTSKLVQDGALAKRELDLAQNRFDLAKGHRDMAIQSEKIALEGTRTQDLRAAEEGVLQARAALTQAQQGVRQAKAAAMQVAVQLKQVDVAKAQVNQASAAIEVAQVGLSYSKVTAPFDGKVSQRLIDPGAMASVGIPLLVVQGGDYRLEAVVPESVLSSIQIGQTVNVEVDSLRAKTQKGRIVEIVPQADATSHTYLVRVLLAKSKEMQAGMFGRVLIPTGHRSGIFVPERATWERDGLHYVFAVGEDGIAKLRLVTVGERSGNQVSVLSGLTKGDRIVLGDHESIHDGFKIEAGK